MPTDKPPGRMKRLLEDPNVTVAICNAFPAIEAIFMEQQRQAVNFGNKDEIGPVILGMQKQIELLETFAKKGQEIINQQQPEDA